MTTPRFLTQLQKHTGTTRSEAITVLTIAALLAAGTVGPWIFRSNPMHEVATADRIYALLDSMHKASTAQGNEADNTVDDAGRVWPRNANPSSRSNTTPGIRSVVNINTASVTQLERIPGIGPATAQAIIKRRSMRPFMHVDDLMDIRGIGPKKLEKMRAYVTCKPAI